MSIRSRQPIRLTVGQRVGLIFFIAILPAFGIFAFMSLCYGILSSDWDPQESIENWIVIGHAVVMILVIGYLWQFFLLLLSSAVKGFVREELVQRYGMPAVEKWFGIKRSVHEKNEEG